MTTTVQHLEHTLERAIERRRKFAAETDPGGVKIAQEEVEAIRRALEEEREEEDEPSVYEERGILTL